MNECHKIGHRREQDEGNLGTMMEGGKRRGRKREREERDVGVN